MRNLQLAFISNKTIVRLINILEFIERNRRFTLGELAENNSVSERTIASDMKYLREYFVDSAVFSSGSNGYMFEEIDFQKYKKKKSMLFKNECLFEIIKNIFYGNCYHINDLAHKYSYSETAFRRLLAKSNIALKSYDLFWSSNPLRIGGDEENLRKFFKDFFYEGIETPYTVFPDNRIHEIFLNKGETYLGSYDIGTGNTPQSFYYTVYISLIRYKLGNKVFIAKELVDLASKEKDFSLLTYLVKEISQEVQITLSDEELVWIFFNIICERTVDYPEHEQRFFDRFNIWPELAQISKRYLDERSIPTQDHSKIIPFLNSFFLSRKINDLIAPVLNKEVSIPLKYLEFSDYNLQIHERFLRKEQHNLCLNTNYFQEICNSFTLYSELIIENYSSAKSIFFLLEGNQVVCQYIRVKARKIFGTQHHLKFIPIQLLTKENIKKEKSDLIVTNYDRYISEFIGDQNYVLIKALPDERDWENIENSLI